MNKTKKLLSLITAAALSVSAFAGLAVTAGAAEYADQTVTAVFTGFRAYPQISQSSCLHIFRHLTQKFLDIRQYACEIFIQSDEKSDCAI